MSVIIISEILDILDDDTKKRCIAYLKEKELQREE